MKEAKRKLRVYSAVIGLTAALIAVAFFCYEEYIIYGDRSYPPVFNDKFIIGCIVRSLMVGLSVWLVCKFIVFVYCNKWQHVFKTLSVISLIILFIYSSMSHIQAGWLASFPNQPPELEKMRLIWTDIWLWVSIASLLSLIVLFVLKVVKKRNDNPVRKVVEINND